MSKKKQNHQVTSFGNLVSKAALNQMNPVIKQMIKEEVATEISRFNYELRALTVRLVALERMLTIKNVSTKEELLSLGVEVEDARDGLVESTSDAVESGDVARIEIFTKMREDSEYQGSTNLRILNVGSGDTLGEQLESKIVGMKLSEAKEILFGMNDELAGKIVVKKILKTVPSTARA